MVVGGWGTAAVAAVRFRVREYSPVLKIAGLLCSVLVLGQPALVAAAELKQPAPVFDMLSQQHGKVVLVDFWASWCGPCRQALPHYEALRQFYGTKGFEVIAVGVDQNPLDGAALLQTMHLSFPQVQDAQGKIAQAYALPAMPTAYLIDRRGIVRQVRSGFNKNDIEPLRQALEQLLEEQ